MTPPPLDELRAMVRQLEKAEANAAFGGAGTSVRVKDAPYLIALLGAAADEIERLRGALEGLLAFAEDAETKALVGDEGCLWPVEAARAALSGGKA